LLSLLVLVALTSATPALAARAFVLIVTNNRSLELGRPDLQYADDDAAKYHELFRTIAPGAQLQLLTELDGDTERLFPTLKDVATPPTKRAVAAAVSRIASDVEKARRGGQEAEFYFIYAGHGDIDGGRGFLELKDARFYSDDLEALLKKIRATHSHVIVDSCNSFFVINARKPGGRRFATPKDAAQSLSKRLPNVGVFLSTSAEADVFEWSELQSGIFSHAVRSGLSGAADADGDGSVSYAELRAFVDIAASGVKNPSYRPKVFARGPGGDDRLALLPGGFGRTAQLQVDAERQVRLTVRDADGLPWIDVFKERGTPLLLSLGGERLAHAVIEERAAPTATAAVHHRFDAEAGSPQPLQTLAQLEPQPNPRGDNELFAMLFTRPFGRQAFADYERTKEKEAPPVFGISRDDTERMSSLLEHVSEIERDRRYVSAGAGVTAAALLMPIGGWLVYRGQNLEGDRDSRRTVSATGWTLAGLGGLSLGYGGLQLLWRSRGEKLHEEFVHGLTVGDDPALVVARAENGLHETAAFYRKSRLTLRWSGGALMGLSAAMFALTEARASSSRNVYGAWGSRFAYGSLLLAGGGVFASSFIETPIERFARLWDADPGIRRLPRVSLAPLPGGAAFALQGEF
jgi:hypothetical protein